jgi:UDP-4-amino-4-deoxy-L-arabinose formyltransferase/UDP-glucuronic acid dehydrogenase (UDP-4-keto-hexauronic acid decarboxylating)
MVINQKLVIFGVKNTTANSIRYIHKEVMSIDLIVTLRNKASQSNHISGYCDLADIADEFGIKCLFVDDYSFTNEKERKFFRENQFDIGISIGWQRIIPKEILQSFKKGIFGFHGSAGYLPFGRGRSPLNWSIIKDHRRFINHCFKYSEDADAGEIYSTKIFEINEFDTIETLQYKVLLVGREQIKQLLEDYKNDNINLIKQKEGPSTWYPKRTPEDGKISLERSTKDIYNLIRAITYPFPGAFLFIKNKKITIWEAYPFDYFIDFYDFKVGEIIDVFDSDFIIKTIDGSLIVKRYEYDGKIKKGMILRDVVQVL